ncbi:MAG TPA: AAA family ATPase [Burkholderiaceae bacterium]|nr:AAA family ATPase [Burkholderiaceae bacterium]
MKLTLSVVMIGRSLESEKGIQEFFKSCGDNLQLLGSAEDLEQGMHLIQAGQPQLIILDVDDLERGVKEASFLVARFPHTALFVASDQKNPDWILRLIRAGAQEYLIKPVEADDLSEAVRKAARLSALLAGPAAKQGSVISVYNPEGGMGTTTIAVNLATILATRGKQTGREAALIDLNPCSGDVAAFLDISPRYNLLSVAAKAGELDANYLRSVMVDHGVGLKVLNGSEEPWETASLRPELLREVIGLSRTLYDHTIIDVGGPLSHLTLAALESSDRILYNTVLSLPAVKNARRHIPALTRAGLGDRIKLVVNRYIQRDDISISDLEKVVNMKSFHAIPNGYADVKASINRGVPLATGYPKSPVVRALEELADRLTG